MKLLLKLCAIAVILVGVVFAFGGCFVAYLAFTRLFVRDFVAAPFLFGAAALAFRVACLLRSDEPFWWDAKKMAVVSAFGALILAIPVVAQFESGMSGWAKVALQLVVPTSVILSYAVVRILHRGYQTQNA